MIEQSRQRLIVYEGETRLFEIGSITKWWSKCIFVVITKTASTNIAFKAAETSEEAVDNNSFSSSVV